MSCQPSPWSRRNVSPSSQHRPVRATVPVSLMKQTQENSIRFNSTNNPQSPPTHSLSKELDDDQKICLDHLISIEKPRIFLGPRGEKSKTLNLRTQPQQPCLRRTASLDAICIPTNCQTFIFSLRKKFMVNKMTQTPEEWSDLEWRKTPWKPITTTGEQLEVKYIRQKLQRTNQNNRASSGLFCSQRQSPIHGDHSAISVPASRVYQASPPSMLHKSVHSPQGSRPIPISPKLTVPRLHNSIEGLNQEIERLVLRDCSGLDGEFSRVLDPPPDGHRAPIAELFHSIQSSPSTAESSASRSHSISPVTPVIPGNPELSISPFSDESESGHKLGTSPHISHFLTREPPDGCEKIMEEPRRQAYIEGFPDYITPPQVTSILLPSQSSAFCPLYKGGAKASSPSA